MNYTIKEIVKKVDITEQGLYKRIKTNYEEYLQKGFIVLNQVEQPNGKKEQIFITDDGLKDLLKSKQLRNRADTSEVLNRGTKPLNQVEQPSHSTTKPNDTETATQSLLNLLNQNIEELKAENKRLNDKLEKQEARFDEKLKEQKEEFKEQFEKQRQDYQKTLDKILKGFNNALLELPRPNEEAETPSQEIIEQEPKKEEQEKRGFFSRLFKKKPKEEI